MRLFVYHRIQQIQDLKQAEPDINAKTIRARLKVSLPTVYRAFQIIRLTERRRKSRPFLKNLSVASL